MPVTKSAQKALRQNKRRKARNIASKKKSRGVIKKARSLLSQPKEAEKLIPEIYKALDKSVKAGVIKKRAASRKKSRLAKAISNSSKQ